MLNPPRLLCETGEGFCSLSSLFHLCLMVFIVSDRVFLFLTNGLATRVWFCVRLNSKKITLAPLRDHNILNNHGSYGAKAHRCHDSRNSSSSSSYSASLSWRRFTLIITFPTRTFRLSYPRIQGWHNVETVIYIRVMTRAAAAAVARANAVEV